MPGLSHSEADAEEPACPICEVPISRVLAERCQLSDKLPHLQSIRDRRQTRADELTEEKRNLGSLEAERKDFPAQIALAEQVVRRHSEQLQKLEAARDGQRASWYGSQRLKDDLAQYGQLIQRSDAAVLDFRKSDDKIKQSSGRVAVFRDNQSSVIARLSLKFDTLVRAILGPRATGRADGLTLMIQFGGDRSTAAIEP